MSLPLLFAAVTSASGCTRSPAEPSSSNATVVKVVDGDTIDGDRGRLRIRVIGIATPEVKKPHYTVGCGGVEAIEYALLTGHPIWGRRIACAAVVRSDAQRRIRAGQC